MPREIGERVVPPLYRPWDPDSSIDFHAARLLLLIGLCGKDPGPYIDGRTKLAKLDFFVRYPTFLQRAQESLSDTAAIIEIYNASGRSEVEAPMIRYRYGPWDHRYRQFLAFLEARNLVSVTRSHKPERVRLTASGRKAAGKIANRAEFTPIVERCSAMRGNLADMPGTALKELVYSVFPDEVGNIPLQQEITP
ncbi:hypothetical protein [Saccharothrix sp. ALI-22-I]|uniref:hypothetical protein n=1 Tax=Saccharothrix sp. ALI-22-I TaxID=1933778 RepID=UPI00117BBC55|nr:hypothetical protein [Saccharothrix sp. ALI-22-I]